MEWGPEYFCTLNAALKRRFYAVFFDAARLFDIFFCADCSPGMKPTLVRSQSGFLHFTELDFLLVVD
jgi:hypothetical protein